MTTRATSATAAAGPPYSATISADDTTVEKTVDAIKESRRDIRKDAVTISAIAGVATAAVSHPITLLVHPLK
jgi:hypothetical protein